MGLMKWLRLPEMRGHADLDAPGTAVLHGRIIHSKPYLRRMYTDFYRQFAAALPGGVAGKVMVELGSGGGFIQEVLPGVVTSDVVENVGLDRCFSALAMPFDDASVDAFFMIDVLHHLPDACAFFTEADRCLKPGGRVVMIEPANTPWARCIYQNFHHEPFDPSSDWSFRSLGPLSSANGAIPWIIFCRDRARFEQLFPRLKIRRLRMHTPLRYLVSGGLTFRQLLPSFTYGLVKGIELLLSPLDGRLGMFMTIQLEKTA